ncbi:MAG: hypothetical protein JWP89_459 [Schlesneria sp.]|nr:hypothetical protein [Schlesneria sp.]
MCQGGDNALAATVKVVAIDKIIVAGSDPENSGPVTVKLGMSVDLMAKRTPVPANGPWPEGQPTWEIVDPPNPFARGRLLPSTGGRITFVPDSEGTWTIKAKCCDSEDTIVINAEAGCGWITNVSADNCFERVDSGAGTESIPMNVLGKRGVNANEKVTLTVELKDGGVSNKVTWNGATQDGSNPLKATIPIGDSVLKKIIVKYDGEDCREIHVWPVWAQSRSR